MRLKITLQQNGEEKTFLKDPVTLQDHYNAVKTNEDFQENNYKLTEQYDRLAELVVLAFDKQFSVEELMAGLTSMDELNQIFLECLKFGGLTVKGAENGGK